MIAVVCLWLWLYLFSWVYVAGLLFGAYFNACVVGLYLMVWWCLCSCAVSVFCVVCVVMVVCKFVC